MAIFYTETSMTLTQQHLDLLVCPACHHPLLLEPPTIRCTGCARLYPIVDGLPRLIPADQA